MTTSPTTVDWH
jgi:hypothetical protein